MTLDDAATPTRRPARRRSGTDNPDGSFGGGDVLGGASESQSPTFDVEGALARVSGTVASTSSTPVPPVGAATAAATGASVGPASLTLPRELPTATTGHVAFAWVDEQAVASAPPATHTLEAAASPYVPVGPDLLTERLRRSPLRAGVLVPLGVAAVLLSGYSATTLLWPLHAVAPTVEAVQVDPIAAPPAALTWPGAGSASVAVAGIDGVVASAADAVQIASITKIVTALVVLDQMPLTVGEQGPEFRFSDRDRTAYWQYRDNGESALDVPVGGSLTQYQLLEGMLVGSANNYADRLAGNLWPTDAVFANAANSWLAAHGVPGVTVVEPTGLDTRNAASPEALITLAQKAMADPVIAEIVAKRAVELPGAGLVENTNGLLADPGVVGIKTGSLDSYNLLSAKDVLVGETTVRIYSAVLGQPDDDARLAASRILYSEVELGLQPVPSVAAGTVTGHVVTEWGENVAIVTDDDADVILWNNGVGVVTTDFSLGDGREKDADVGSLSVQGPLNAASTTLSLADDVDPPTAWWRLTHPLALFGLD